MSYSLKNTIIGFFIKYFKYILVALVIILVFLSTYFILMPKYNQITGKGYLDYEQKKQTLESKKVELSELTKLKENLANISSIEKERMEKILPSAKELPDIFLQMERLAVESGLKVSRISIKDAGSKQSTVTSETSDKRTNTSRLSGIQTITVSLSVEGDSSYESLKILLDNIEDNMRIIDLDSLSFTPSAELSEGSFALNLNTYYLE